MPAQAAQDRRKDLKKRSDFALLYHEGPEPPSDIDRMLVLRRVPIFEALAPEDLQRVAAAARERGWSEDDELMLEGDVGSELIVIVEGNVRVIHRDGAEVWGQHGPHH